MEFIMLNKRKSNSDKDIICNYKGNIFNRSAKSFISNPKLIFNLLNIKKIFIMRINIIL